MFSEAEDTVWSRKNQILEGRRALIRKNQRPFPLPSRRKYKILWRFFMPSCPPKTVSKRVENCLLFRLWAAKGRRYDMFFTCGDTQRGTGWLFTANQHIQFRDKTIQLKRENPILVFPVLGKPVQENPTQLNTNILNKYISSTEISNPILSPSFQG